MTTKTDAGRRVVVVDDCEAIATSLALVLRSRRGLDARAFTRGVEALRWCAAHRPELALLDVQMPGLNGVSLALQLRAMYRSLRIVFVTGSPEDLESPRLVEELGASPQWISKPVQVAEFLTVVDRVLAGRTE